MKELQVQQVAALEDLSLQLDREAEQEEKQYAFELEDSKKAIMEKQSKLAVELRSEGLKEEDKEKVRSLTGRCSVHVHKDHNVHSLHCAHQL